jgi:acetyltransferase-like isoleucine patch superfamily enzyme
MSDLNEPAQASRTRGLVRRAGRIARGLLHRSAPVPGPILRPVLRKAFDVLWVSREVTEWAWRSFVATPFFLAQCESHGRGVSVDRMPYMTGRCRIRLGSDVRVSGHIDVQHARRPGAAPLLSIGSGVFIGHRCTFSVADRIEIGNFVSIGGGTFISDTNGHSHKRLGRPIWEDPADPEDVAPVVIEDDVHIGHDCIILKGVRIGTRSVIGARSVVRANVPPDSIIAGNPGRVAGWRPRPAAADGGHGDASAAPAPPSTGG